MKRFLSKYAEWVIIVVIVLALLFVYYALPLLGGLPRLMALGCDSVTYYAFGNVITITDPGCKS